MKKVTAIVVSIGVILVITGLVMVGIFGGEELRNINWQNFISGMKHDLSSANACLSKKTEELNNLQIITVSAQRYSVYVLPSEDDTLSVKFVEPLKDNARISVNFEKGNLKITETDDVEFKWFGGLFGNDRFVAVYVPKTQLFTSATLRVDSTTAGVKLQDMTFASVTCVVETGEINLQNVNAAKIDLETDTGAVNVDGVNCTAIKAKTETGSINVDNTNAVERCELESNTGSVDCLVQADCVNISVDTGSVNFDLKANTIVINTDTGSVDGTVNGNKEEYQITIHKDTGKSNLSDQSLPNATKFLTVKVDTGSIDIDFENN